MSSHRLSVSGDRTFTQTGGGGAFSSMQYPSKPGDRAAAQFSSFGEIAILLPAKGVTLERYEDGDIKFQVLRLSPSVVEQNGQEYPQPVSINLDARALESFPHALTNVDIRKDDTEQVSLYGYMSRIAGAEPVEKVELDLPPTEA